jgi:hypothetical protein
MQDLFAAARDDAPADVVRDQVWGRVAAATAVPAGAAAAAKVAVPASGKLIAVGAAIGAAGVVVAGLAFNSLVGDAPVTKAAAHRTPAVVVSGPAAGASLAEETPRGRAVGHAAAPTLTVSLEGTKHGDDPERSGAGEGVAAHKAPRAADEASALAEEARLVTEARAALVRGEPESALALARTTHRLAVRALEPEELALEARALRALGRTDEALATELTLRRRFPSHALSR